MTNSNTIYANAIEGVEDQYLVYILYRDGTIPHYVGATKYSTRPYDDRHHARTDYNVTSVEIVQEGLSREDASILEDQLINHYGKTIDGGTLVNVKGGGIGLITHTDEAKAKMSHASKTRIRTPLSDEHKAKLSATLKGRAPANKGNTISEETRTRMSLASTGRTHSDETRAKMSLAKKGCPSPNKGRPMSDEQKAKIAAANRAYWARRRQTC